MSDTEWKELQTQLQQQGDPAAEQQMAIEQMKLQNGQIIAEIQRDTEMMRLASNEGIALEKIAADLEKVKMQTAHKERMTAAEFTVKKDMGTGI